jgi:hypothetical protein
LFMVFLSEWVDVPVLALGAMWCSVPAQSVIRKGR